MRNRTVAFMDTGDEDEQETDAAFIVRAVNNHEELVKIAEAYRNLLRTMACAEGQVATFQHIETVLARIAGFPDRGVKGEE